MSSDKFDAQEAATWKLRLFSGPLRCKESSATRIKWYMDVSTWEWEAVDPVCMLRDVQHGIRWNKDGQPVVVPFTDYVPEDESDTIETTDEYALAVVDNDDSNMDTSED